MTTRRQMLLIIATLALIPFLPETKPLYATLAREYEASWISSDEDSNLPSEGEDQDNLNISPKAEAAQSALPIAARRQSDKSL